MKEKEVKKLLYTLLDHEFEKLEALKKERSVIDPNQKQSCEA